MGSWGEQFSTGDQGGGRDTFHSSGRAICPSCGGQDIKMATHVAGCRHNGDGYGTEVFTCQKCNWTTSFQYDEQGDIYYYEMRGREPEYSTSRRREATSQDKAEWENMWYYSSAPQLRERLLKSYFCDEDIDEFIQEMTVKESEEPKKRGEMIKSIFAKYKRIAKLIPESGARLNMDQEGLSKENIDLFFAEYNAC